MKKTETMNVLIETNKMLREEKEGLEQELQQMQAKVSTVFHLFLCIQVRQLMSGYITASYLNWDYSFTSDTTEEMFHWEFYKTLNSQFQLRIL